MKQILAISGSLRAQSTNSKIIRYLAELPRTELRFNIYQGLSALPAFNPDLDTEGIEPPAEVSAFRKLIRESDGVLICSPEYVFSVPGALKNALDWTVSTGAFIKKPTVLITASGLGEKAHESLLLTLKTLEAIIVPSSALLISHARTKLDADGKVSDVETVEALKLVNESLAKTIDENC